VGHYAGQYRVTIQEATEQLGVKEGAVRKRIERGTIRSEKDVDGGRVYVYVDEPPVEDHDTGYDNGYDASHDAGYDMLASRRR
jgi:excisionase family DNA binding protein